jgi:WXG100 family type VII secretion target
MADSSTLSVNFGNMDQLVTELTSIVNQTQSTLDDLVAQLNSTLNQQDNWGGAGQASWQGVQTNWNNSMNNMHQILNMARQVTSESAANWPSIEQSIVGLFG